MQLGRERSTSIAFALLLVSCAPPPGDIDESIFGRAEAVTAAGTLSEGFESASKGSYSAADVTLASGTWRFDDALLGALDADAKNGSHAARLRGSGSVTMGFDVNGAGSVSVRHASYGSDGSGSWGLFYSQDQGATWTQAGAARTTTSALATASFDLDRAGAIRFELRKLDGGSNRIDLDDLVIDGTSTAGSSGSAGSSSGSSGSGSASDSVGTRGAQVSAHTALGLPSAASTANWDDYLSVKSAYVLAYDSSRKTAHWVSWQLDSSYLGEADRTNNYRTDSTLPSGMPQATDADYAGSGWDRGHLCPSADRTLSSSANGQTFYLSNMIPQASQSNSGPWAKLEAYERTLANQGKELYIVAGGVFSGRKTIGDGVAVPEKTWKVIVVLDGRGQGAADVTTSTRVIAVEMPNDDAQLDADDSWQQYRVSARTVEDDTGLDFLADVPARIQDTIETRIDNQ